MAKYRDKRRTRSKKVPFKPGEPAHVRHNRRKAAALDPAILSRLQEYCERKGFTLSIKNEGHHFIVSSPDDPRDEFQGRAHLAQWWPSSAKLILRCTWRNGIHVHDGDRVIEEIENFLQREMRDG